LNGTRGGSRVLLLILTSTLLFAGDTLTWTQADYADFQKGVRTNLSIRSDGRLSLAPRKTEVADSSAAYLWALARDSRGNLYAGGGPGAKLLRITPAGKTEKVAEFDALEIHAIAIDAKDRVYAATSPDGKVYRIDSAGKSYVFYDPKQKYIWSMLFDKAGNLFIATGDRGEIHKVAPDGSGGLFFRSDETHMRSLALDLEGNLIAGTEPGGLVIRISPHPESKDAGFVVYQMPRREVTALAIGPKNEIYAAAVGSKNGARVLSAAPPAAPPAAAPPLAMSTAGPGATPIALPTPAPAAPAPATVPGGSDIYLIPALDSPSRLWTSAEDIVYSLAFDPAGHLLVATGNKGNLYRLENHALYTTLVTFPGEQVTALLAEEDGAVYAATGNVGKVFRVGPALEREGTLESDVFDSGGFARWGRIQPGGELNGGAISLTVRSGNLDRPQKNWSPWSQPVTSMDGGAAATPPARFVQWKATLTVGPKEVSPWLDSVDIAYLRRNVAPKIDLIDITPYNYRFPAPSAQLTLSSAATLTLPAIGARPPAARPVGELNIYPAMTYQKGALGVRWTSSDENGDTLVYSLQIRGASEKTWKPLREKLREKYYSFDSTAFPDGEYLIRVTASDAPSNTPEDALATSEDSDPFTIDNTPPVITGLQASGAAVRWHAADALSTIYQAEYSLDGGEWTVVDPVGKLSDAKALDYSLVLKGLPAGEHVVAVRVSDENDNMAVAKTMIR
jgi:sugar lactone lactonase YvrE